jgi:hypothetical protein
MQRFAFALAAVAALMLALNPSAAWAKGKKGSRKDPKPEYFVDESKLPFDPGRADLY